MNQEFEKIISQIVEETLDAPPFANLTRPEYEQMRQLLNNFFNNLIVYTLFNNLSEAQLTEADKVDFSSPEAGNKFAQWAAEIPNFLFIYEEALKKNSEQIKLTGKIPTLEI